MSSMCAAVFANSSLTSMPRLPYCWNVNGDRIAAPVLRSVRRLPVGQRLAVVLVEQRLGVERIDLRRPAVHEQVDDVLRLRREVRRLRRERIERAGASHRRRASSASTPARASMPRPVPQRASISRRESRGIVGLRPRRPCSRINPRTRTRWSSAAVGEVEPSAAVAFRHERQGQLPSRPRSACGRRRSGYSGRAGRRGRCSRCTAGVPTSFFAASRANGPFIRNSACGATVVLGPLGALAGRVGDVERRQQARELQPVDVAVDRAPLVAAEQRHRRPADRGRVPGDGEQRVVQRLEVEPPAVQLPEQPVLRIDRDGVGAVEARLACRSPRS